MFKLYDTVKLKENRPDIDVTKENVGTIIDYIKIDDVYSVEFVDKDGDTIERSLFAYFKPSDLIKVSN